MAAVSSVVFGMQKRDNAAGTSDWPNRAIDWLRGDGL
jgi:hypothetical protein